MYSKCKGGILPDCPCSDLACDFNVKTECECLNSAPLISFTCSCYLSTLCCNSGCSVCDSLDLCKECKHSYAQPEADKRCHCDSGFFGPDPLENIGVCTPCNSVCLKCSQLNLCIECIEPNAVVGNDKQCYCKEGFYGNSPLIEDGTCMSCNAGCSKCDSTNNCIECFDINAEITAFKCYCKKGYHGNQPLSNSDACTVCASGCSECSSETFCIDCIDKNAKVIDGQCICKTGFFGSNISLNEDYCQPCPQNCLKCINSTFCTKCKSNMKNYIYGCYCDDGYFMRSNKRSCVKCSEFCNYCYDVKSSLKLLSKSDINKGLYKCKDACFFSESCICKNCTSCLENCLKCNFSNKLDCLECSNGYDLVDGICNLVCDSNRTLYEGSCNCNPGFIEYNKNCIDENISLNIQMNPNNHLNLNFSANLSTIFNSSFFIPMDSIHGYGMT